jgi:hypothetical protein
VIALFYFVGSENPCIYSVPNRKQSYVWGVAGYADQKGFAGFLVASDFDKEKFVHFVSFDEWQKVIDAAIKNGAF